MGVLNETQVAVKILTDNSSPDMVLSLASSTLHRLYKVSRAHLV